MHPWERVPNIRAYYARLAKRVLSDTFTYFWGQIVSGAVLGVATALLSRHVHWIPNDSTWTIVGVILAPYGAILLVSLIINALRGPVKLDNDRQVEIENTELLRQKSEAVAISVATENAELKKPRRTVAEQLRHDQANAELATMVPHELAFIRALLHHEQISHHDLHKTLTDNGIAEVQWMAAVDRFRKHQRLVENILPGPFRPHEYWRVNPHFMSVLIELLSQ